MKNWLPYLATIALVALVLSTILLATSTLKTVSTHSQQLAVDATPHNKIEVKVYRGGSLVASYEKVGDPWNWNLMALIGNLLFGRYYSNPLTIYWKDGTTATQVDTEYASSNPYLAIGIGSGTASPTPYDIDLSSVVTIIDVPAASVAVSDNGTHIIAQYSVSYTASSGFTLSEVGLYWKGCPFNTNTYKYALLARDVLSTPISVLANDVVTITYTIAFKYNQPPMTKNLAALLFDYVLGLKYYSKAISFTTTDGTSASVADYGMDYYNGVTYDGVKEYAYVYIGTGQPSYIATISQLRGYLAKSPSSVTVSHGTNSTHFWFTLTTGIGLASSASITEFGLTIESIDVNDGSGLSSKSLLLLYFPLQNPVSVPAGGGVRVSFTLAFRWSP
ncbi:MAG: hypothetical protein ACP5IE_00220 [Infirmifilum sp.]